MPALRRRINDKVAALRVRVAPRRRLYRLLGKPLPSGYGRPLALGPMFSDWTDRMAGGRVVLYPDAWRVHPGLDTPDPARVAVVIHVFYPELLPELLDGLRCLPVDFDLFITNSSGAELDVPERLGQMRSLKVFQIRNHGRDIWPTVALVNTGALDPYLLILKLHTKKSAWRSAHETLAGDGTAWRTALITDLLGSEENVISILSAFSGDPLLGQVTADGSVADAGQWGDNQFNVIDLAQRLEMRFETADLRFAAGSMYWCRGLVLQGLRALAMTEEDFEEETGQINGQIPHAIERLVGIVTSEAGLSIDERSVVVARGAGLDWRRFQDGLLTPRARFVPFYLPQFHRVAENDAWWGTGFTEWTNVASTRPVYPGQHQPRVPADLGFYDLRSDETRADQAAMARDAGVNGFMYYYYWFAGQRLLNEPIEAMRRSTIDFPYCIMWANENWTRRWDGNTSDVLMAQDHEHVPPETFIDDVAEFLQDTRYLTVDGRKVLAVYRPAQIPDLASVVSRWREEARRLGVGELHLLMVDVGATFAVDGAVQQEARLLFDGALAFPPHNFSNIGIDRYAVGVHHRFQGAVYSYAHLAEKSIQSSARGLEENYYPAAMVGFDNTARRQWESDIWFGSNPYAFRRWLGALASAVSERDREHRLIFINAWNEWAESAVLEPTLRQGRSFLMALRDVAFS